MIHSEDEKQITLREQLANFEAGKYDDPDVSTQCDAGWYDWFCNDRSLAGKTKLLYPKVRKIAKSSKVNLDTMYVFFKNNCPMCGSLYDDFRICDVESGDVIYTITPRSGYEQYRREYEKGTRRGLAEVWGRENDFNGPITEGTWKDIIEFFLAE